MATAKLTFTLNDNRDVHSDGQRIKVSGSLAIQANPATYITNGIPIPAGLGLELVKSQTQPRYILFWSTTAAGTNVYVYDFTNNSIRIYVFADPGPGAFTELANGAAIPAGVSGDTILFTAEFFQNF